VNRRRRLEQTVARLRRRYGERAVRRAAELERERPPAGIPTGFPELDQRTGCGGIPRGRLTLLSGRTTSGKLTLAYKVLAQAQDERPAALVDLSRSSDPDYLARCGVALARLLLLRPDRPGETAPLLVDLVASRRVGLVLLDGLPDLAVERTGLGQLGQSLARLQGLLRRTSTTLLVLDEPQPPWLGWFGRQRSQVVTPWADLWVALQRERWLLQGEELVGYQARARVVRSRWAPAGATVPIAIRFNGVVQAARTW